MQELICILHDRYLELRNIIEGSRKNKDISFRLMRFQFNQMIQEDRWKKIVEDLAPNQDATSPQDEIYPHIKALTQSYRGLFQQLSYSFPQQAEETLYLATLNELHRASLEVSSAIKLKQTSQSQVLRESKISIPFCLDNYPQLLKSYSEKIGLSDQIDSQLQQKTDRSVQELVMEGHRANIKIKNAIKQYISQHRIYINRAERRRLRKMAYDAQKREEKKSFAKNISPLKKIMMENVNIRNRESLKKEKVSLPPALKKIEFPFLNSVKPEQSLFFSAMPKKVNKKATTVPSESISQSPSIYGLNEFDSRLIQIEKMIPTCEKLEKVSLTILKKRIRDKLSRKEDKSFLQSHYCFDDKVLKRGVDERLFLSNKGLV